MFCKEIPQLNQIWHKKNNKLIQCVHKHFYQQRKTKFGTFITSNACVNNYKAGAFCKKKRILNPIIWMLIEIWHLNFDDALNIPILPVLDQKNGERKYNLYSNSI